MYKEIFFLLLILFASACSKDKEVKTSGTHTITSEMILEGQTYSYYGFSFSKASVKLYNVASSTDRPDFGVGMNQDSLPYFDTENIEESFALAGEFSTADSALTFFNNYGEVDVNSYVGLAQPVLENQIWVFKTRSNTFGKILIMNTLRYEKNSYMIVEVHFKWVYQPDGSSTFLE
ncbi:MAG: hypothetical protein U9N53_01615 [Bacteroidota bacterium]|nr:hypothetical protein [Bacteroidota bacterium]